MRLVLHFSGKMLLFEFISQDKLYPGDDMQFWCFNLETGWIQSYGGDESVFYPWHEAQNTKAVHK